MVASLAKASAGHGVVETAASWRRICSQFLGILS